MVTGNNLQSIKGIFAMLLEKGGMLGLGGGGRSNWYEMPESWYIWGIVQTAPSAQREVDGARICRWLWAASCAWGRSVAVVSLGWAPCLAVTLCPVQRKAVRQDVRPLWSTSVCRNGGCEPFRFPVTQEVPFQKGCSARCALGLDFFSLCVVIQNHTHCFRSLPHWAVFRYLQSVVSSLSARTAGVISLGVHQFLLIF